MGKKNSDTERTHSLDRVGMEAIDAMPALLDTKQAASILGTTPLHIAKMCAAGKYKAAKCGKAWLLNKSAFLEAVGLA